jgi:hypothetical protein
MTMGEYTYVALAGSGNHVAIYAPSRSIYLWPTISGVASVRYPV